MAFIYPINLYTGWLNFYGESKRLYGSMENNPGILPFLDTSYLASRNLFWDTVEGAYAMDPRAKELILCLLRKYQNLPAQANVLKTMVSVMNALYTEYPLYIRPLWNNFQNTDLIPAPLCFLQASQWRVGDLLDSISEDLYLKRMSFSILADAQDYPFSDAQLLDAMRQVGWLSFEIHRVFMIEWIEKRNPPARI